MNGEMRDYTRKELLELRASQYLRDGFVDSRGKPLAALQMTFATAAATQFKAAELSPQELAFTYEALKQTLPLHAGKPHARIEGAVAEALEITRAMIKQPNHAELTRWLNECAAAVKTAADLDAFVEHFMAVLRQYTVIAASAPR
jgi:hypothetical protein